MLIFRHSKIDLLAWIPLTSIITEVVMRAVGSLPVMFTLLNELYPTEIRTQSIAINDTIGQWFLTF